MYQASMGTPLGYISEEHRQRPLALLEVAFQASETDNKQ